MEFNLYGKIGPFYKKEVYIMHGNKVSFGILTYRRIDDLKSLLLDLQHAKYSVEIIILNNNEDFCILSEIEGYFLDNLNLKYIWDKVNYGVSNGRRKIVEACNNDILILLDDDVYIPDVNSIIDNVQAEFSCNEKIGGLAFHIKDYYTKVENRYEIPHKNKNIDLTNDFYTYLMIGAGMAVKTELVKKVGNFSSALAAYGFEEVDLGFRIINSGHSIKYKSNCIVEHKKSPDGRFSNDAVNYFAFLNRTLIAKKYFRNRYYYSCFIIRGLFLIYKTKKISLFINGAKIILNTSCYDTKFTKQFYAYCKKVNAFLLY